MFLLVTGISQWNIMQKYTSEIYDGLVVEYDELVGEYLGIAENYDGLVGE